MSCEFCSGSFWLDDNKALGPCVCATAEALLEALEGVKDEAAGVDDQLAHANERLTEAWDKIRENPDVPGPEKKSLAEATDLALDLAYAQGEGARETAADALRRYLIRQGLSANPLRLEDPDLDALADALF